MSLTRHGCLCNGACPGCPGSDVYVWPNGDDQWECSHLGGGRYYFPNFPGVMLVTAAAMVEHLEKHRALGHHVDPSVMEALKEDPACGGVMGKISGG